MSLHHLAQWLESTAGSTALRESLWVYPIVETSHVLSLCVFLGLLALMDLRLVGVALDGVEASQLVTRVLPWALAGFAVSVATGLALFYSSPVRMTHNVFFRAKLLFLCLAGVNAWAFHNGVYRHVGTWGNERRLPRAARLAGLFSLLLWGSVVVSGRMIAYNWFDCDKPLSPVVSFIAGCPAEPR